MQHPTVTVELGGEPARRIRVERRWLPWALMELHQELEPGTRVDLTVRCGATGWTPTGFRDVVEGAGFVAGAGTTPEADEWVRVHATRARTLPDFVGPDLCVLLCGLNPSEYAADVGRRVRPPGQPVLARCALRRPRDERSRPARRAAVARDRHDRSREAGHAPRADALSKDEYRAGAARLERLVGWLAPRVVCFVGLTGYRAAIDRHAVAGVQASGFGGAIAYVMPNPSGVNAHVTVADLAGHLRAARALAA